MKMAIGMMLLSASAVLVVGDNQNDPRYGGVPLTTLLEDAVRRGIPHQPTMGMHNGGWIPDPRAEDAVRQTGTNALPYLVEMIRENEPSRRARLAENAFRLLGATATPAIPALESVAQTSPTHETSSRAVWVMRYIGSNSVPALARLTTNALTRVDALTALISLGAEGVAVRPILEDAIAEGDMGATIAVMGLRNFQATNAFPILTNVLHHPKVSMRKVGIEVFELFDTQARSMIPALTECLYDPDAEVRQMAANVLRRLAPEMFVTNSVPRVLK